MVSSVDITNRTLAQIGSRSQITSMTDGSQEATYGNLLYNPLRDFLLREGDYDFSIREITAVAEAAPAAPWTNSWEYPTGALRIRQLIPTTFDANDPRPIAWTISGSALTERRIYTRELITTVIYTFPVIEDLWDPMFTESFTRIYAAALAFALQNRIEASKEKLEQALAFAGLANLRDS